MLAMQKKNSTLHSLTLENFGEKNVRIAGGVSPFSR